MVKLSKPAIKNFSVSIIFMPWLLGSTGAHAQHLLQGNIEKTDAQLQSDRSEQAPLRLSRPALIRQEPLEVKPFNGVTQNPISQTPEGTVSDHPTPVIQVSQPALNNAVLGVEFDNRTGVVRKIFPGSDAIGKLLVSDVIMAIDGSHIPVNSFQRAMLGQPGTVVQVTVVRLGRWLTYPVVRKDWRIFMTEAQYDYASPLNAGIVRH